MLYFTLAELKPPFYKSESLMNTFTINLRTVALFLFLSMFNSYYAQAQEELVIIEVEITGGPECASNNTEQLQESTINAVANKDYKVIEHNLLILTNCFQEIKMSVQCNDNVASAAICSRSTESIVILLKARAFFAHESKNYLLARVSALELIVHDPKNAAWYEGLIGQLPD